MSACNCSEPWCWPCQQRINKYAMPKAFPYINLPTMPNWEPVATITEERIRQIVREEIERFKDDNK